MKMNHILFKVYVSANGVVSLLLLFICILLGYEWKLCLSLLGMALLISTPPVLLLHLLIILLKKIRLSTGAAWMVLFGCVPITAFITATLLVDVLPGDTGALAALAILSSYFGILSQGFSIAELFNSFQYETE